MVRGKNRLTWKLLGELNRVVLAFPERLAYDAYHALLDARLLLRWRQLQRTNPPDRNFNEQTEYSPA